MRRRRNRARSAALGGIGRCRSHQLRRGKPFGILSPAVLLPAWLGEANQSVWGCCGRWLALAVGHTLTAPYLLCGCWNSLLLRAVNLLFGPLPVGSQNLRGSSA